METENHNIKIQPLESELELINNLRELILTNYSELFYTVIVHGSVATGEIIAYSDFDGLLIIKDEWVNSKKLKDFKLKSLRNIYKFDPLQHHGWFEIKESDLLNYPESYLPINILKHSKTIYPENKLLELKLKKSNNVDYNSFFVKMLLQFEKRELEKWRPKNSYQLKSFLSQIMLFPCLYYSSLNSKGIFKRESFDAVKGNFNENEWMPIELASKIRNKWKYNISDFQKVLLTIPNRHVRKIITRFFSPKIPLEFQQLLNDEFYENLNLLIKKIKKSAI